MDIIIKLIESRVGTLTNIYLYLEFESAWMSEVLFVRNRIASNKFYSN